MTFKFIKSGVDLAVIQLFTALSDAPEHQWLRVERRVNAENIESDTWCGPIISTTDDVAVADEE